VHARQRCRHTSCQPYGLKGARPPGARPAVARRLRRCSRARALARCRRQADRWRPCGWWAWWARRFGPRFAPPVFTPMARPIRWTGGAGPLAMPWRSAWVGALCTRFDGPPYHPFQQWADRAEALQPGEMLLRVRPAYGLWHAYRFALALPHPFVRAASGRRDSSDHRSLTAADLGYQLGHRLVRQLQRPTLPARLPGWRVHQRRFRPRAPAPPFCTPTRASPACSRAARRGRPVRWGQRTATGPSMRRFTCGPLRRAARPPPDMQICNLKLIIQSFQF